MITAQHIKFKGSFMNIDVYVGYISGYLNKTEVKTVKESIADFVKRQGGIIETFVFGGFMSLTSHLSQNVKGIVACNISSLGASLEDIKTCLLFCRHHNLQLMTLEEGYCFNQKNLTDLFFQNLDVVLDIRRNLISQNTKRVLQEKKKSGTVLGRKVGSKFPKKLAGHETEIKQLMSQYVSKTEIAQRFHVTRATLYNFIRENQL